MKRLEVSLHGHRMSYRICGRGPVLLLIHGIAGSSGTWAGVMPRLGEDYTVIAPDLLGHGHSAKPRGDYSLGAYANGIRDLLDAIGHERATVLGHSLGGGVAMQFSYQFPERAERLVLVSSGGLGRSLHAILRAPALPGAEFVLPWLCAEGPRRAVNAVRGVTSLLGRFGLRAGHDLEEVLRNFATLGDPSARQAFLQTVRSVVDVKGQRVSAVNRLYLAGTLPTLIVWGEKDPLIPVGHARAAHGRIPGSRLEIFPGCGHFPYLDDPDRFVEVLRDFMETTEPARAERPRDGARRRRAAQGADSSRPAPTVAR